LRSIEKSLTEIETRGILPVAISVDSPAESANLCRKAGYTFPFLSDPNTEVIRRYDVLHSGGAANGHDIARPAEFLVDTSGVIRWVNLTDDLRVRARPEQILKAAEKLQ